MHVSRFEHCTQEILLLQEVTSNDHPVVRLFTEQQTDNGLTLSKEDDFWPTR